MSLFAAETRSSVGWVFTAWGGGARLSLATRFDKQRRINAEVG